MKDSRMSWDVRAAYLRVLKDLKDAVNREADVVQVGAEETVALGWMLDKAAEAREVYQCQVRSPKPQHSSP